MKRTIFFIIILFIGMNCILHSAYAKSKYTNDFIRHFALCREFSESRYNLAYNSQDTYEIRGYTSDGSNKCIYVETNAWDRGTFVTTCKFDPKQLDEYLSAMRNPDVKTTVLIKGMAFIDANENAVYLKYYNNPKVCNTVRK